MSIGMHLSGSLPAFEAISGVLLVAKALFQVFVREPRKTGGLTQV